MIKRYIITPVILLLAYSTVTAAQGEGTTPEQECKPRAVVLPLPHKKGNAAPEEVLEGRTFTNKDVLNAPGTMPNREAVNIFPKTYDQQIPEGFHNGSGVVHGDPALAPENIRSGTSVFGVNGTSIQASGNATTGQVLDGQTFSNSSGGSVGTMANQGNRSFTPATAEQSIPAGFHNGSGVVHGDPALVPENIRSGATIFGVAGQPELVDTRSGDAVEAEIFQGKKAWVGNYEVTGSMVDMSGDITPSDTDIPIPAGYHNGTGMVKGDPDLVPKNIRAGTTLFGVTGTYRSPVAERTVTSPTGLVWMNRNLGAHAAATGLTDQNGYGDLYQWGRLRDGHEHRGSLTTSNQSGGNVPRHGMFITGHDDWRGVRNDNLWQGVDGVNNPCPVGFRLPTETEWLGERQAWGYSRDGAINSPLKLPPAGYRLYTNGGIISAGFSAYYWSSTVNGAQSRVLFLDNVDTGVVNGSRGHGASVRCIKD